MPLIIISGFPCAGKSHRAAQIAADFDRRKSPSSPSDNDPRFARSKIHIVSDESLSVPRSAYASARTEKDARAEEMSAVKRLLTRDDVVIADGMNYIKGFRYQMYCEAKALGTPSCVIHVGTPIDTCREQYKHICASSADGMPDAPNPSYDAETFENLLYRYEEPNGMTRWDSPLFTILHDDPTPPVDAIWDALLGARATKSDAEEAKITAGAAGRKITGVAVRPNAATVLAPASESDYLYALDRDSSAIVAAVQAYQAERKAMGDDGSGGGEVVVDGADDVLLLPGGRTISAAEMQRLRRQFVQMMRTQGTMASAAGSSSEAGSGRGRLDKARVKAAFVGYLNDLWERE